MSLARRRHCRGEADGGVIARGIGNKLHGNAISSRRQLRQPIARLTSIK